MHLSLYCAILVCCECRIFISACVYICLSPIRAHFAVLARVVGKTAAPVMTAVLVPDPHIAAREDDALLQFLLNMEYLSASFLSYAVYGGPLAECPAVTGEC